MQTHISTTIDNTTDKEKFDASVKELLADKQILARILKYSVDDFANEDLSVIINCIGEPEVSKTGVDPGETNILKANLSATEDSVLGEGMISSQKQVEFTNSNYDDIKPVRSIWICMDSDKDEDSINKICFTQNTAYGKDMDLDDIDKVQAVIIRLRDDDEVEKSKNTLIAMLEELLKSEQATTKKKRLTEEYGIVMTSELERRVNVMCNLSDLVEERAIEKGIEQGIEQGVDIGEKRKLINIISKKIAKGKSITEIADMLEENEEEIQQLYNIVVKYAPDFEIDKIMNELFAK